MLVVSRRENDSIYFPTLGITVEVMKLTRSRVSLGVVAPRAIKVIRKELKSRCEQPDDQSVGDIRPRSTPQIDDDIEAATKLLRAAQDDLLAGKPDDALLALAKALADLDALRDESNDLSSDRSDVAGAKFAGGVAESTADYAYSENESRSSGLGKVLLVDFENNDLQDDLVRLGFEIDSAPNAMAAFYQLSRHEKPNAVLLAVSESSEEAQTTIGMIRHCSQFRDVPILFADGDANITTTRMDASSIAEQLRTRVAQRQTASLG